MTAAEKHKLSPRLTQHRESFCNATRTTSFRVYGHHATSETAHDCLSRTGNCREVMSVLLQPSRQERIDQHSRCYHLVAYGATSQHSAPGLCTIFTTIHTLSSSVAAERKSKRICCIALKASAADNFIRHLKTKKTAAAVCIACRDAHQERSFSEATDGVILLKQATLPSHRRLPCNLHSMYSANPLPVRSPAVPDTNLKLVMLHASEITISCSGLG